jgi:hypothetical protein
LQASHEQYTIDIEADKDHKSIQRAVRALGDEIVKLKRRVQELESASHTH